MKDRFLSGLALWTWNHREKVLESAKTVKEVCKDKIKQLTGRRITVKIKEENNGQG